MTDHYSLFNGFPFVRHEKKRDIKGDRIRNLWKTLPERESNARQRREIGGIEESGGRGDRGVAPRAHNSKRALSRAWWHDKLARAIRGDAFASSRGRRTLRALFLKSALWRVG